MVHGRPQDSFLLPTDNADLWTSDLPAEGPTVNIICGEDLEVDTCNSQCCSQRWYGPTWRIFFRKQLFVYPIQQVMRLLISKKNWHACFQRRESGFLAGIGPERVDSLEALVKSWTILRALVNFYSAYVSPSPQTTFLLWSFILYFLPILKSGHASLSVTIFQKGKKNGESNKKLLDNVWGEVPEKQTTAIMGPRYCVLVAIDDDYLFASS